MSKKKTKVIDAVDINKKAKRALERFVMIEQDKVKHSLFSREMRHNKDFSNRKALCAWLVAYKAKPLYKKIWLRLTKPVSLARDLSVAYALIDLLQDNKLVLSELRKQRKQLGFFSPLKGLLRYLEKQFLISKGKRRQGMQKQKLAQAETVQKAEQAIKSTQSVDKFTREIFDVYGKKKYYLGMTHAEAILAPQFDLNDAMACFYHLNFFVEENFKAEIQAGKIDEAASYMGRSSCNEDYQRNLRLVFYAWLQYLFRDLGEVIREGKQEEAKKLSVKFSEMLMAAFFIGEGHKARSRQPGFTGFVSYLNQQRHSIWDSLNEIRDKFISFYKTNKESEDNASLFEDLRFRSYMTIGRDLYHDTENFKLKKLWQSNLELNLKRNVKKLKEIKASMCFNENFVDAFDFDAVLAFFNREYYRVCRDQLSQYRMCLGNNSSSYKFREQENQIVRILDGFAALVESFKREWMQVNTDSLQAWQRKNMAIAILKALVRNINSNEDAYHVSVDAPLTQEELYRREYYKRDKTDDEYALVPDLEDEISLSLDGETPISMQDDDLVEIINDELLEACLELELNCKIGSKIPYLKIKEAHKSASKRYHPDKNNSGFALKKMPLVNAAYDLLSIRNDGDSSFAKLSFRRQATAAKAHREIWIRRKRFEMEKDRINKEFDERWAKAVADDSLREQSSRGQVQIDPRSPSEHNFRQMISLTSVVQGPVDLNASVEIPIDELLPEKELAFSTNKKKVNREEREKWVQKNMRGLADVFKMAKDRHERIPEVFQARCERDVSWIDRLGEGLQRSYSVGFFELHLAEKERLDIQNEGEDLDGPQGRHKRSGSFSKYPRN